MKRILILLLIICTLSACSATKAPDEIIVNYENLFPEGIEYDEIGERFLLGSASERAIFQVFDDGTIEPFIQDPDFINIIGLEIDRNNQRLLVVNNGQFNDNKSYLHSYDLATGERIFISDISKSKPDLGHYTPDVAVDAEGNAYVTDSSSPAIYRVDMEGNPALFLEHAQFDSLNGIVYHPDGFLLLGSAPGLLLKIPLDNPEVVKVDITEGSWDFEESSSMKMHPDGTLIMVTFPDSEVRRLKSADNWETVQTVSRSFGHGDGFGTKIAIRGEEVYIIYSHLGSWGFGIGKHSTFEIVRLKFE